MFLTENDIIQLNKAWLAYALSVNQLFKNSS